MSDVGAVRMLARIEVRRRRWRVVVLTVLVGVVGGLVLSTVAGARRTGSALARFNASSRTSNVELTVGDPTPAELHEFAGVKGVESFAPLRGIALEVLAYPNLAATAAALDARFGSVVDRARVVAGRAADPDRPDEVTIGEGLASQLRLGVGDRLDTKSYTPQQVAICLSGGCSNSTPPDGPRIRLQIVGIVRRPLDLGDRGASGGVLVMPPAFTHKYGTRIGSFGGDVLRVRTRHGAADLARVTAAARRIFGKSPDFSVQDLAVDTQGAANAIDALSVALWVFAAVAALAGLVAITIVLGREISLTATDQATERALGLTRRQRIGVGTSFALPVAIGGSLIALVGAVAASPVFPIGVARRAEADPGVRVDGIVLALGTVAIAVGILLIAFLATIRTTRRARSDLGTRRSTAALVETAGRAGLTPVATAGLRMALEPGRGPTTVPVRSAMFGAVFGVLGVVAVLMFATSLDHLAATPGQYGWTWSFATVPDSPSVVGPRSPLLHEPGVAAADEVDTVQMQLDGHPVTAWGFRPIRRTVDPEIVAGRSPSTKDEIALGNGTLSDLGKTIGDRVHGDGPDGSHEYRIVGRAVFPRLDEAQPLANGATLTSDGLARVLNPRSNNFGNPYVVVRVQRGTRLARVERRVAAIPEFERPFGPTVPVEVDRLRQISWLPGALAALLAALAFLAVGHALVTGVRRRRRELAVLKTLGFDRRQVRATVAWQATTLAVIGLVVGIPTGLLVGGLVWRRVADGLGISNTPAIPTLALLVIVPSALIAANLVAYLPARAAARTHPAVALRTE